MKTDVIVIGAGLAGMCAAISAQAEGAAVCVVDRGAMGTGTNSAISNGVFTAPTAVYPAQDFIRDTLQVGKATNHLPIVQTVAREGPEAMRFLRSLGLELLEGPENYTVITSRPDVIRGFPLVQMLAQHLRSLPGVTLRTGVYVTALLRQADRVIGVRGFDRNGQDLSLRAPAVILATGGAGAVYRPNDNQKTTMGQGYLLAAQAGLDLWDMEFVQFYPVVMDEPRLPELMLYPPYPNGTRLINARGEDIARKHGIDNLGEAMRKKRDSFSALLFQETLEGRVFMDFRQVSAAAWDRYPLTLLRRMKFDFKNRPCAVTPGTHFFMGGVRIDEASRTARPGLFACGEVTWGLHGANRRGGNALTECVVFGRIAGRHAALSAMSAPPAAADLPDPTPAGPIMSSAGTLPLEALRRRMQAVAWKSAGVVRSEQGLREGLEQIAELDAHLRGFAPTSPAEKRLRAHLAGGLFTVKAVLTASSGRHETRGAFIRSDCPAEDPSGRAQNSCLTYDPDQGTFRLRHHAVAQPETA